MNPFLPVQKKLLSLLNYPFHIFIDQVRSSNMDSIIADPLQEGDQFRGPCEAGRFPLVRSFSFLFVDPVEFIRDNTSRDTPSVHHFRYRLIEDVDISNDGDLKGISAHKPEEFVKFPGIEADLGNQKVRPRLHFLVKFIVLCHHLRFIFFKWGEGATFEKMGGRKSHSSPGGLSINFKSLVHLIDKMDELNKVEVEDRFCLSLKSIEGKVTGHQKEV